jgi:hypothetical protein
MPSERMRQHVNKGFIAALITFVLMMTWSSIDMYLDPEIPNSPIALSAQRYWIFAWSVIAFIFTFAVMTAVVIFSAIVSALKQKVRR